MPARPQSDGPGAYPRCVFQEHRAGFTVEEYESRPALTARITQVRRAGLECVFAGEGGRLRLRIWHRPGMSLDALPPVQLRHQRELFEVLAGGKDAAPLTCGDFVEWMAKAAVDLAGDAGAAGITTDDLRRLGEARGIKPRHPNWWGLVFPASKLVAVRRAKTKRGPGHHREVKVWVLPEYAHG